MSSITPITPNKITQTVKPAVTFICSDAGETDAFVPVLQRLEQQGVNYKVLASGTAARVLAQKPDIISKTVMVSALTAENLQSSQVKIALTAPIFLTGVMTTPQLQLASHLKQLGKQVIGFYDSLSIPNNMATFSQGLRGALTGLMVPSLWLGQKFKPLLPTKVVGHPQLSQLNSNPTQAMSLYQQLGIQPNLPTVLFIGGWYTPQYQQSFHLFCQSLVKLKQSGYPFNTLVSQHPKYAGQAFENQVLAQYGLTQQVKVLPSELRAKQVLPITQAVVSHDTSFTTYALASGKPVSIIGPQNNLGFVQLEEQLGLLKRQYDAEQVSHSVLNSFNQAPMGIADRAKYYQQALGIAPNGVDQITNVVKALTGE